MRVAFHGGCATLMHRGTDVPPAACRARHGGQGLICARGMCRRWRYGTGMQEREFKRAALRAQQMRLEEAQAQRAREAEFEENERVRASVLREVEAREAQLREEQTEMKAALADAERQVCEALHA